MVERISRREFLEQTSLVGAAAVLGTDPKDFPRRVLGRTGVRVPVLAMGCGSRFLSYESEDAAAAAINLALELGIRYLDTAYGYGNGKSETRVGEVIKNRRKEVFFEASNAASRLSTDFSPIRSSESHCSRVSE